MKINFESIADDVAKNFRGGEREVRFRAVADSLNRVMRFALEPGASIGEHLHDASSEAIYIVAGTATAICDGAEEALAAGECHYCPKGHTHSLKNTGSETLVCFAVVPRQ